MKKYTCQSLFIATITCICVVCHSCKEDSQPSLPDKTALQSLIMDGSLLVDSEKKENKWCLYFETDTLIFDVEGVSDIRIDRDKWESTMTLSDNSVIRIPTLGKSVSIVKDHLSLNPLGYTPLSATLQFSAPVEGRIKLIVKGKKSPDDDMVHLFKKYGYNHQVEIHGLYPGYDNTVYVCLTDKNGNERARDSIQITTESLQNLSLPKIQVVKAQASQMEPGLSLVNFLGDNEFDTHRPFMIDANGEIRWILNLKGHPSVGNLTAHTGLSRMKNGNFLCGNVKTGHIIEIDMLGDVKKIWDINALGYEFHHEVTEMPNGNFLVTVTKKSSKLKTGEHSICDYVIEMGRETGNIVTEWDLKQSLDETRSILNPEFTAADWAHNNAVVYSEKDDAIIVSLRFQGVFKINRNNQVVWILSPQHSWGTSQKGTSLSGYVLNPLDATGTGITDRNILDGSVSGVGFDWVWGSHCPVILPDDNLLIFDNGFYRNYVVNDLYSNNGYSRAVCYKINESNRTVQQLWEYGKERGRTSLSIAVSSVQYLPQTGNILFSPGVGTRNLNGIGGQLIEVDYNTKEIVFEAHISTASYFGFHRATRISLYP